MEHNLRKVNATDLFIVTTIISKIGLRELKECFKGEETLEIIQNINKEGNNDTELATVGMSVMVDVLEVICRNLEKCQSDIFRLLANLSGMKIPAIEKLDGTEFIEMLTIVIKDNAKDFIGVASKLFNMVK